MDQQENKKKIFSKVALVHLGGLKRYALSLCKNNFDADDLVSETILKAFQNFEKLKDQCKIKQWLFRILNNLFISNCRKRKYLVEIENESLNSSHEHEPFSLFESIAKSGFVDNNTPEKVFISKLTIEDIQVAINELPIEFKQSLILCDLDDFSYAEISGILNIPIGTVRSRIARARAILHKKLWHHAIELGIIKSTISPVKKEYVCTCGKEEAESELQTHDR